MKALPQQKRLVGVEAKDFYFVKIEKIGTFLFAISWQEAELC